MYRIAAGGFAALLMAGVALPAQAQSERERIILMEKTVQDLLKRDEEREKRLRELETEVTQLRGRRLGAQPKAKPAPAAPGTRETAPAKPHDHDHAHSHAPGHAHTEGEDAVWSTRVGDGVLKLNRIGLDLDAAFGWSNTRRRTLETLFAGGHDPRQNGFTLRAVELSFSGSYDPYFDAFVNIVYQLTSEGESKFELEEAWIQSKKLFNVATLKGGLFFTPFGAINGVHAHEWDFQTQPVILSRVFGEDGHRGLGFQAKFDLPTPWRSALIVGAQNARGETQASFLANDEFYEERPIGGYRFVDSETDGLRKLVYFGRLTNAWTWNGGSTLSLGLSGMMGPNSTGNGARTYVWGVDAAFSVPLGSVSRLRLSAEFVQRIFRGKRQEFDDGSGTLVELPGRRLSDVGVFASALVDLDDRWTIGGRYEYASSTRDNVDDIANGADPFRGNRHRFSPLVIWRFAPLGRVSFQYNLDHAQFLRDTGERRVVHSAFINVNWRFGLGASSHIGHDH